MNIDFTAIADARKGTVAVNRIYKGNTLVWSRYNWEKWSCQTNYESGIATSPHTSGTMNAWTSMSGDTYYNSYDVKDGYIELTDKRTGGENDYLYNLCAYRSIYQGSAKNYPGDSFVEYSRRYNLGDGPKVDYTVKQVKETTEISGYSKGSTNYGIVTGSQGDYPSNGRHSDGYWYVSVGAMGFEEGEGNP